MFFFRVVVIAVCAVLSFARAESMLLPGEKQPLAPKTLTVKPLPRLVLKEGFKEVQFVEYFANDRIEVAHAVLLFSQNPEPKMLTELCKKVVLAVFAARPKLAEVDISVHVGEKYRGFGGPLPLFTASVPTRRMGDFLKMNIQQQNYDRFWYNPEYLTHPYQTVQELDSTETWDTPETLATGGNKSISKTSQEGGIQHNLFLKGFAAVKVAALTFDDAPHPIYAPLLLDVLARYKTKATFFVIGRNAFAYPYFVRDMVQAGHEVANHTYHHVRLTGLSAEKIRMELLDTNFIISSISGEPVRYVRPPGGQYDALMVDIAKDMGLVTTFWTADPGDFTQVSSSVILQRLKQQTRAGGIILLHDNAAQALGALPGFLDYIQKKGLQLTTVGILAEVSERYIAKHKPAKEVKVSLPVVR